MNKNEELKNQVEIITLDWVNKNTIKSGPESSKINTTIEEYNMYGYKVHSIVPLTSVFDNSSYTSGVMLIFEKEVQ